MGIYFFGEFLGYAGVSEYLKYRQWEENGVYSDCGTRSGTGNWTLWNTWEMHDQKL